MSENDIKLEDLESYKTMPKVENFSDVDPAVYNYVYEDPTKKISINININNNITNPIDVNINIK